jgi:hypothetical protein
MTLSVVKSQSLLDSSSSKNIIIIPFRVVELLLHWKNQDLEKKKTQ